MGIPSVPLVTKAFKDLAILNAGKRGMPHERICFTPHPVWGKTPEELRVYAPQSPVQIVELASSTPAELLASGEPFWQTLAVARAEREEPAAFREVFLAASRGQGASARA